MIKVNDLRKIYDKNTRHANEVLHGISLSLDSTGFVCILGQSGCGKTSLLNAIGGLDDFDGGSISTESASNIRSGSKEMERERTESFGYIFQNYYLLKEHSAAYNVYLGMHSLPLSKKEKSARVRDALRRVDMSRYKKRLVGELSGGQQQRIAIARAIARRPKVIFADEPTGNLDEANTINICSILKELSRDSLVVMVTHEERIARLFADRIITLDAGRIVSDTTEWTRSCIDAGAKDTLYSGDYNEEAVAGEKLNIRLLTTSDASPVTLTVIADGDRIIIKHNDPRVVLCSQANEAPFLENGKHPIIDASELISKRVDQAPPKDSASDSRKKARKGLGFSMLLAEARSLTGGKRLRKFSAGLFIILLTLMISISVADILTVSNVDPEDFITTDSHTIRLNIERSQNNVDKQSYLDAYKRSYKLYLMESGIDFDFVPSSSSAIKYTDHTFPQLNGIGISFRSYNWVDISHLDESKIISGRMPERSDEVVIDKFTFKKMLSQEGILQNMIPNAEYFLGKTLSSPAKTYSLKIVGICDTGEPSMYMSREAMLAFATCGTEVITRSEYLRLTGDDSLRELDAHSCIAIKENTESLTAWNSVSMYVGSEYSFIQRGTVSCNDPTIGAKLIIADEVLDPLFTSMIMAQADIRLYLTDKQELYTLLDSGLPEELDSNIIIEVDDKYERDLANYKEATSLKLDARRIVTITVIIAGALMLYLMQRSKIRERMDLLTVYRLLGIKKRALLSIFCIESTLLTIRYSLPTIRAVWLFINIAGNSEMLSALSMVYPIWAAAMTLVAILVFELVISVLPTLRLLALPPARLAAKYDL